VEKTNNLYVEKRIEVENRKQSKTLQTFDKSRKDSSCSQKLLEIIFFVEKNWRIKIRQEYEKV